MTKPKHIDSLRIIVLLIILTHFSVEASSYTVSLWSNSKSVFETRLSIRTDSESNIQDTITPTDNLIVECPQDISTYTALNECTANISSGLNINVISGKLKRLSWLMSGATEDASPESGINLLENHIFNTGTTIITYTAGNDNDIFTCSFRITVIDNEPPVVAAPQNLKINCNDRIPSPHTTLQAFLNAGGFADDNCGLLASSFELSNEVKDNGTCPFTIARTYQVADNNGNISIVRQLIFVTDEDSISQETLDSTAGQIATASVTKNDVSCRNDANGSIQLVVNGASGLLSYNWSTSNGHGLKQSQKNQTSLSAGDYNVKIYENAVFLMELDITVKVADFEPPVLLAPENMTIQCNEKIPAVYATWNQFERAGGSGSDNCQLNYSSFRLYSETKSAEDCPYTITRTYSISDEYGNTGRAQQRIFVEGENVLTLKSAMAGTTTAITNGNWNDPATWDNGVPDGSTDVVIPSSYTVTLTDNEECSSITIDGTLNYFSNGAYTLQVYGDWTNNGTYDGGTNGIVEFTGSNNATINGSTAFEELIISKGNLNTTLTINGTNSVTSGGSLTMTSGLVTIPTGGNFTVNPALGLDIEKYAGFDVTGGILTTGNFTITNEGLIRISTGTANLGSSYGNEVHTQFDGAFIVSGGNVNISARLYNSASGTLTPPGVSSGIHISGGTVTLATVGSGLSNVGSLNVTATGTFDFSGGTIVFQNPSTAITELDLGLIDGAGIKNTVGGTFQFGNASSPVNSSFNISSEVPLFNVTTSNNADLILSDDLVITNQLTLNGNSNLQLDDNSIQIPVTGTGSKTIALSDDTGNAIPVILNFTGGSFAGGANVQLETFDSKHTNNANTTNYLKRFWSITTNGITNPVYNITATYSNSDIIGSESGIAMGIWTGSSPWAKYGAANTGSHTISATGIASSDIDFTGIRLAPPTVSVSANYSSICIGSSADITATATGDLPLSYLWSSNPSGLSASTANITVSPTTTTTYTVLVTDGNGFTTSDDITITVNPLTEIPIFTAGAITVCQDAANETYTATAANSTSIGYTVSPAGAGSINSSSGVMNWNAAFSGTATITATATGLCGTTSEDLVVTVNPSTGATSFTAGANTVCQDAANKTYTATAANSTSIGYTVSPAGAGSINSSTGVMNWNAAFSGIATITATATGSCGTTSEDFVVTVNPTPTVNKPLDQTVCNGISTVAVNFTGTGTSYTWTNNNTAIGLGANGTGNIPSFVATNNTTSPINGTIIVTPVYSNDGVDCTGSTQTFTITVNPDNTITLTSAFGTNNQETCILTSMTSITYSTTGATEATFLGLPPGVNGNWNSNTIVINGTPTVTGGFNYTITLTGGCGNITENGTITVNPDNDYTLTSETKSPTICIGNPIPDITWSTTGATGINFTGLPSGVTGNFDTNTHIVTVSGTPTVSGTFGYVGELTGGCGTTTISGFITVTPQILATAEVSDPIDCNGSTASVLITVTDGGTAPYTFYLEGKPSNHTGLFGGLAGSEAGTIYNWSVTDSEGCDEFTGTVTVFQPEELIAIPTVTTPISCPGGTGTVTIDASGGTAPLSYTFNGITNSTGTFNNVVAGNYNWSVKDANNCSTVTGTMAVTQPDIITITSANVSTPISCNGGTGTVTIVASGGTGTLSYTFNGQTNNTGVFNNVYSGTNLSYSVTDANNCGPFNGTINVPQPSAISANASVTSAILCNGETGTVTITASGGTPPYSYTFNGITQASNVFTGVSAGTNIPWSVTDANGCEPYSRTLTVNQPNELTASVSVVSAISCFGSTGTVRITASGGTGTKTYSFEGQPDNTTGIFSGIAAGTYNWSVEDANGCFKSDIYDLGQPSQIVIIFS